jgi:cellulose biosynthesis protein BcsQ
LERAYIQKVKQDLEAAGQHGLFETVIPARAALGKAAALCVSLFEYEPGAREMNTVNEVRDLYRALAREVETRVGHQEESPIPEIDIVAGEAVNA